MLDRGIALPIAVLAAGVGSDPHQTHGRRQVLQNGTSSVAAGIALAPLLPDHAPAVGLGGETLAGRRRIARSDDIFFLDVPLRTRFAHARPAFERGGR